jgi:hypothetical protein
MRLCKSCESSTRCAGARSLVRVEADGRMTVNRVARLAESLLRHAET